MTRPLAIVTGASSGIGEVFSRQLAARGYNLLLVARRATRLEKLAAELSAAHGIDAATLAADLATTAGAASLEARIAGSPALELLVNNAGFGSIGGFFRADVDSQDQMHRLHVLATMRLTHAALRGMLKQRRGAVINVSSVAGFLLSAGSTSYCSTKAWMNRFTEGLYLELKALGSPVKVQALCPGYTYSEFHDKIGMDRSRVGKGWWCDAAFVVSESLRGLDRNKLYVIPGWRYRALVRFMNLLPRSIAHAGALWVARRQGRL